MRADCLTYTSSLLKLSAGLVALVLLFASLAAANATEGAPVNGLVRLTGSGSWGPANGTAAAPAQASWLVVGDQVHGFRVMQGNTSIDCHDPAPGRAGAEAGPAPCSGRPDTETTYVLEHRSNGTHLRGTFEVQAQEELLAPAGAPPSGVPGLIVLVLAVAFGLAAVALGVLYLQERRISRFLVRRLYEETKGRMPSDWPEDLRHQWIARLFVRGKN